MRYFTFILLLVSLTGCFSEEKRAKDPAKSDQSTELTDESSDAEKAYIPHKALYEVTMVGAKSSSQILDVNGEMFYELSKTCEGWITNHSFNLIYSYVDVGNINVKSDFSTFESRDGDIFEFTSQRRRDGNLYEKYKGSIEPSADNTGKKAVYETPADLSFDLSENTIFPIAHTVNILNKFDTDERFYNATVFDGSDDTGPYEINAFIGQDVEEQDFDVDMSADGINSDLLEVPAKKVRLAFFPVLQDANESEYEMTLFFHENGIASQMVIEYPEFTVKQTLKAIEALEQPKCQE